ncbi:MAG: motility associated factor glycosyltransferase family protein [Thermodesulfobacteriota bacterium]
MNAPLRQDAAGAWFLGEDPLHPAQGALAAARAELAAEFPRPDPRDLLIIAGMGLGWHARAALDQPGRAKVLVYEPDPRDLALAAALGPELAGASIAHDDGELEERLSADLVYGRVRRVRVFSPPAHRRQRPELGARVSRLVADQVRRAGVDQANRAAKQETWLEHLAVNFKHVLDLPDVAGLAGRYRGAPALVIGAGPSLDASLPRLAGENLEHVLTLAAASALGPLARAGLAPELALALEAKDESRQFAGADPRRTLLAAASQSHPNHFAAWPGRRALFHLSPWLAALTGGGPALPSGGHATSAAFSLAVLMGCDPIALVGQDLAFSQGRSHASGRPGGEEGGLPGLVQTPGIHGGMVETSEVMAGYITWYREAAAYLAGRPQPVRVINATAQGARLDGFEHMLLEDALAVLRASGARHAPLAGAVGRLARPAAEAVGQGLAQVRGQVRQALAQLESDSLNHLLEVWPATSAVGETLRRLPAGAESRQARAALVRLSEVLGRMWEGLYA